MTSPRSNAAARLACVAWLLVVAVALSGCGSGSVVSGKVVYKGDTLKTGEVSFISADGKSRSGLIGADGKYEIIDAPLGDVTIVVVATRVEGGSAESPLGTAGGKAPTVRSIIPRRYGDPKASGLTYRVTRGRQVKDVELTD